MRSAVAISPTISGFFASDQAVGHRHAEHDRDVGGLDAAIGEIDAGRRLRRPGNADQHDVGLVDLLRQLAVVMLHGEVQRVDAAEIFGVEHMLRADPAAGRRAEIGLEDGQHRLQHRHARQAHRRAALVDHAAPASGRPPYRARCPAPPRCPRTPSSAAFRCGSADRCARSRARPCIAPTPRGRPQAASRRSRPRSGAGGRSSAVWSSCFTGFSGGLWAVWTRWEPVRQVRPGDCIRWPDVHNSPCSGDRRAALEDCGDKVERLAPRRKSAAYRATPK